MGVIFELKLNSNKSKKSNYELVCYITGYFDLFEKLRIEKLTEQKSPKVYDCKLNILTEGETQLYYQTIRGQILSKQNDP